MSVCPGCQASGGDAHHEQCAYDFQPVQEFDCPECKRHMIVLCGPVTTICAACHTMPGWHKDPALRSLFDRGGRHQ